MGGEEDIRVLKNKTEMVFSLIGCAKHSKYSRKITDFDILKTD